MLQCSLRANILLLKKYGPKFKLELRMIVVMAIDEKGLVCLIDCFLVWVVLKLTTHFVKFFCIHILQELDLFSPCIILYETIACNNS
jgi:hypothetical protein